MLPIAPDTLLQQRYRIRQILGEGRFGRTYLATDNNRSTSEYCAIEELIPSSQFPATVAKAKEFFQRAAEQLYRLQHPQLPKLWATFEEQNRLFIVQEYIEGETYADLLEERRNSGSQFSEYEVWQFVLQTLPVLSYLHNQGSIHRNLSPANIIRRDSDLLPVLIDFGIIKEFAGKLQANPRDLGHTTVGTVGYMSPEQAKTGQASPHSDLYSLAVVAVVLLTGKEPIALFEGDRMNWDWRKWTHIDDEFAKVLQRMLSPQSTAPYQSAIEIFQSIAHLDIPESNLPQIGRTARNRPSEIPTMVVPGERIHSDENPAQSAMTNLNLKSVWEKPQVFIPLGILISLLAGVGSWLGVSQLTRQPAGTPVATTPPKQVDFNNPTIPTDSNPGPNVSSSNTITPQMGQTILKEGTVDARNPVRYKVTAIGGQNLDIQLVPIGTKTGDPLQTATPSPTAGKNQIKPSTAPSIIPVPSTTPLAPTQVLMTILSPAGTPIDERADRVTRWSGEINIPGDYIIELRPIAGLKGTSFPYKVSVTQTTAPASPPPTETDPSSTIPPVVVPIPLPGGDNGNTPPTTPLPNPPQNKVDPVPVPIEVPSTRPEPAPEPRPRKPKRTRITPEPEGSTPTPERTSPRREQETPPPRRKRKPKVDPDAPKPAPSPEPEAESPSVKPQTEPAMTPPASDNQAPQPSTSDGSNSAPAKTPKPSSTPNPGNTDTD